MTALIDVSRCPLRCHDRGSCFTWPSEPEFPPICACNELWEGKTCEQRQHNPFRPFSSEKASNTKWRAMHGVACTFNETAATCAECGEHRCGADGECEWKAVHRNAQDGQADSYGCTLRSRLAPFRPRILSSRYGKTRGRDTLPWASRGFCGETQESQGSSCGGPADLMGSWALSPPPDASFLWACLSHCVTCSSCHYVSVSRKAKDCSWYRACSLTTPSAGYLPRLFDLQHHSYQVRHDNGTTVRRIRSRMAKGGSAAISLSESTLESENVQVQSLSSDGVCLGDACMSWAAAHAACSGPGGWRSALPPPFSLEGALSCEDGRNETCSDYATQPWSVFQRSLAWPPSELVRLQSSGILDRLDRADAMHGAPGRSKPANTPPPSCSATPELCLGFSRPGYVLTLTQSLCPSGSYAQLQQLPRLLSRPRRTAPCRLIDRLPCSSARFEDGAVLRSFFTRADGGAIRGGSFLEMGAYDGNMESTTRFFEGCLGWRGVLVEAMPRLFRRVVEQRRSTLNLRLAACARHGWANFTNFEEGYASISKAVSSFADATYAGSRLSPSLVSVQCGPLGDYLAMLNVRRIDFFSLDVEGAELVAIQGLNLASGRLSVGVLMVEVRGDGVRPRVLEALLALGFTYVGQVHGRPSQLNEIIDDIYVNETHLREHFPESAWLRQERAAGSARLISRAPSRRFARRGSANFD